MGALPTEVCREVISSIDSTFYIKIENSRTEKFRQKTSDKKLSDKYDIKKQERYQKDVKTDCDSIININLQRVHRDHYIYKDISM